MIDPTGLSPKQRRLLALVIAMVEAGLKQDKKKETDEKKKKDDKLLKMKRYRYN
jgi:hypothetical protein